MMESFVIQLLWSLSIQSETNVIIGSDVEIIFWMKETLEPPTVKK